MDPYKETLAELSPPETVSERDALLIMPVLPASVASVRAPQARTPYLPITERGTLRSLVCSLHMSRRFTPPLTHGFGVGGLVAMVVVNR